MVYGLIPTVWRQMKEILSLRSYVLASETLCQKLMTEQIPKQRY